jgi:hypothetical protein
MVNSTDDLPPYEGQITENADTGEPYLVTIPFLGVRSSNGSLFTTGATVSLAAAQIANPGFRAYASFTSSGPRSGDSAISPDVAAPGVSISSAAVGSGNGAASCRERRWPLRTSPVSRRCRRRRTRSGARRSSRHPSSPPPTPTRSPARA